MTAFFVSIVFEFQQPVQGTAQYFIGFPQVCHLLPEVNITVRHLGILIRIQ